MSTPHALLRDGLLGGLTVLAAPRTAATDACAAAGANVQPLEADLLDEAATQAAAAGTEASVLVVDTRPLFGAGGADALRAALDGAWSAVRAHFAPERAGKVVLIAPRSSAGPYAEGLRAGLENLARTLSVEWARYGVRTTALLPGEEVDEAEVAQLVAFLASPAGDYYSGCRFDLT
jgi:NAD(P)-dependent dehydrogenase (short-subunit alcohol dehydrogenase family)